MTIFSIDARKDPQDNIFHIYTGRFFGPVYHEENLPRGTPNAKKVLHLCKWVDRISNNKVWHIFSIYAYEILA